MTDAKVTVSMFPVQCIDVSRFKSSNDRFITYLHAKCLDIRCDTLVKVIGYDYSMLCLQEKSGTRQVVNPNGLMLDLSDISHGYCPSCAAQCSRRLQEFLGHSHAGMGSILVA